MATGESVLGKKDFPPVAFYLCQSGKGDISTPWVLSFTGRGSDPCLVEKYSWAKKIAGQGSDPRFKMNAEKGYINIQLSDSYIINTVNELAGEFEKDKYNDICPDDSNPNFLQDYLIYLATNYREPEISASLEDLKDFRQLGVLIVYGDISNNVEKLKDCLYFYLRQGSDPRPEILMAAARLFTRQGSDPIFDV